MDVAEQERLRQFLAGRAEIAAGDRMVLRTLRSHARERQRLWLGVPRLVIGTVEVVVPRTRRRLPRFSDEPAPGIPRMLGT